MSALTVSRRAGGRTIRAAFAAFAALCMNLLPFVPARASAFDDVVSVMRVIDKAAPGALPFTADQLVQYRAIIEGCAAASNTDAVLQCVEAASSTDVAQDQGVPSWFPQLIAVYFDIEHHDYWGLAADAGEAVACAGAEVLTGVDVCGAIKTLIEAGKEAYEAGKATVDAVEDFFSDLGSGLEDLGCDVASLWGGCSSDSPPPPPTAATTASGICGPRGGVKSLLSHSNAPDDVSFECNDGTQCRIRPGQQPQCQTPAGKAAAEKQKQAQNQIDFATRPQQWAAEFDARWRPQCPDDQCRLGLNFLKANILALAKQRHEADPDYPWAFMGLDLTRADQQAQVLVDEGKSRSFNAKTSHDAADGWKEIAVALYTKQCKDQLCLNEINDLGEKFRLAIIAQQAKEPDQSSLHIQGEVNKVYGPMFKAAVDRSIQRASRPAPIQIMPPPPGPQRPAGRPAPISPG